MNSPPAALFPFQTELVQRLMGPGPIRLALAAPTGMGKTRAVLTAVLRIAAAEPSTRILIIAPAAIANYLAESLAKMHAPPSVRHLAGSQLRAYQERDAELDPGVYLLALAITREAWARDVIASQPWSLVIVDEAMSGGVTARDMLEEFAASESIERLCATASSWKEIPANFSFIEWILQFDHHQRLAEPIQYRRNLPEIGIRQRLTEIEDEFGADRLVRASLDSAWRSSTSALEFVLARQVAALALSDSATSPPADYSQSLPQRSDSARALSRAQWANPLGANRALDDLLGAVGALRRDSKLEAFREHILERAAVRRIAVFTAMRQTAAYLHAALDGDELTVTVIDGSRPVKDRTSAAEIAQVAIVTDAVVPALELASGFEGCSYDLPGSARRLDARWATLDSGAGVAVMAFLFDSANADPVERRIAEVHPLIEAAVASFPRVEPRRSR